MKHIAQHVLELTEQPADWTERQALRLGRITEELRQAAASLERGGRAGHARTRGGVGGRTITIGLDEARTLLRAIEPHALSQRGRRGPTRRVIVALAEWWRHFQALSLTPPITMLPAAIEAALLLRDELGGWIAAMRWHQATTAARTNWPVSTSPVLRQSTATPVHGPFLQAEEKSPGILPRGKKPRAARKQIAPPGQRHMLLPIATPNPDAAATEAAADAPQHQAQANRAA